MGKYYTKPAAAVDDTTAYAATVNNISNETNTGFNLVDADMISLEVSVEAWALLAQKWAEEPEDSLVEPGSYSSLHWAAKSEESATDSQIAQGLSEVARDSSIVAKDLAEKWAEETTDVPVEPGLYSAHHWSDKSSDKFDEIDAAVDLGLLALGTEGNAQILRVVAEGDTQDIRVTNEGNTQVAAVIGEGGTQVGAVTSEGGLQVSNVATEGAIQIDLATAQAEASEASAVNSENSAVNSETWAEIAQSVACQDLAAIQEIVDSSANFVDVFIYDTSKDSDGGAWRKRCQDLSWYNETLNTSTRGATREFPAVCLVVAETDTVTLYDLTDPSVPMWMVLDFTGSTITSAMVLNGRSVIVTTLGLFTLNLLTVVGLWYTTSSTPAIVNNSCNDVAMTVLPDAPIDQITGLPVPTIAVATDGGVNVIDGTAGVGTVVNSQYNQGATSAYFDEDFALWFNRKGVSTQLMYADDYSSDAFVRYVYTDTIPAMLPQQISDISRHSSGGVSGLTLLKENPTSPADGMVAYITKDYFSGWMKGDIKLATLADSEAGDITSADPVEDRSVNDNPLDVVGTITKAPVTTGSELMAYSGFSATDYIEQPYNSDLDFGTGDFYVMGWFTKSGSIAETVMHRSASSGTTYTHIKVLVTSGGNVSIKVGSTNWTNTLYTIQDNETVLIMLSRVSGITYVNINGTSYTGPSVASDLTEVGAILRIGLDNDDANPASLSSVSLLRIGAGAPSDEQIKDIYEMEKKLFEEDAKYLLPLGSQFPGDSDIDALDYDKDTQQLAVMANDAVALYKGVLKVKEYDTTGTHLDPGVSISINKGTVAWADSVESVLRKPAILLREELEAKNVELSKALAPLVEWDYTSDTDFKIPLGYYPEDVYSSSGKYARSDVEIKWDGYNYWCTIGSASAVYITGRRL